jgi:hypothetical protein
MLYSVAAGGQQAATPDTQGLRPVLSRVKGWGMRGLLVLETPWEYELDSAVSVGPFLQGLGDTLGIKVVCQRFNGRSDLVYYLEEFSQKKSEYSYCYVASHGTAGRLETLLSNVNASTIADACRGSRGRGFIIGACSFGNRRTAAEFLDKTDAAFVAGYSKNVPWEESMLADLCFLTYLIGRRCRRRMRNDRVELETKRNGDFRFQGSRDPIKIAKWVYEDFPLSRGMGFVVHRERKKRGRWRIESSLDD